MKLTNNDSASAIEMWPVRPWAEDGGVNNVYSCSYEDVFGVDKMTIAGRKFATKTFGGTHRSNNLGPRSANMLVSVLAAVIERYYLSRYACHGISLLPGGMFPGQDKVLGNMAYCDDRVDSMQSKRKNLLILFRNVLHGMVCHFSEARTEEKPFGKVFPSVPYANCQNIKDWNTSKIYSLCGFLDCLVNCGNDYYGDQGIWKDITQRQHCRERESWEVSPQFRCILRVVPRMFACRKNGYRPALRNLLNIMTCLSQCHDTITDFWNRNGSFYGEDVSCVCTLSDDYLSEWSRNMQELICECYVHEGRYFRFDHIFTNGNDMGNGWPNPFGVSLAMALLAMYGRFQMTSQNVGVTKVEHWIDEMCLAADVCYHDGGEQGCGYWTVSKYFRCLKRCLANPNRIHVAFGAKDVCYLSVGGQYWLGAMPRVMYRDICYAREPIFMDPVYCYYRCKCWDKPYRRWVEYEPMREYFYTWRWNYEKDLLINPASIVGFRQYHKCWYCKAGLCNCFIHLGYPNVQFPNLDTEAVTRRLCKLRNAMPYLRHYNDGKAYGEGESGFKIAYTDWNGELTDSWLRDTAYCSINKIIDTNCQQQRVADIMRVENRYCRFVDICTSFNPCYFGWGANLCADIISRLCGGKVYLGPLYDKITYDGEGKHDGWHYWKWDDEEEDYREVVPICRERPTSIVPEKWTMFRDLGEALCIWHPSENGYGSQFWSTIDARASIQFGGFFQINKWDFKYLQKEQT